MNETNDTPARPASGETLGNMLIRELQEDLAVIRSDCRSLNALVAQREADLARLTREMAEARAELVKTQELLGISVSRTTAARAEAARLREALAQNAELLDGVMAAGAFNRGRLWEHIREVAMQMRRALGQEGA